MLTQKKNIESKICIYLHALNVNLANMFQKQKKSYFLKTRPSNSLSHFEFIKEYKDSFLNFIFSLNKIFKYRFNSPLLQISNFIQEEIFNYYYSGFLFLCFENLFSNANLLNKYTMPPNTPLPIFCPTCTQPWRLWGIAISLPKTRFLL